MTLRPGPWLHLHDVHGERIPMPFHLTPLRAAEVWVAAHGDGEITEQARTWTWDDIRRGFDPVLAAWEGPRLRVAALVWETWRPLMWAQPADQPRRP